MTYKIQRSLDSERERKKKKKKNELSAKKKKEKRKTRKSACAASAIFCVYYYRSLCPMVYFFFFTKIKTKNEVLQINKEIDRTVFKAKGSTSALSFRTSASFKATAT